ncbi:hydroxymethylbilane synthase [Methanotorris formicicus]|uniref:Probable porphobilinogen deaminase n=1 Tax=Methanotorris formicicus Mc-S-70 TaxID=647171 RepID=H1KWN0_9EURY|nr:hydroxymethylbilane synthase [Methanotorris formicicus]EHP89145.1 porphobilinogen deaminase [Methanotorris formicicus Mc-S-70]
MKVIIGTRGSKLALTQTYQVADLLKNEGVETEIKIIKTFGDKIQNKKLSELGIGVFTKELDLAMLNNEIDIAVHSLKDVPTVWNENLIIAAMPKRESYHDLIIWNKDNEKVEGFLNGKEKIVVGTSSIRRKEFLKIMYPNIEIKLLRGNVDTRLNKLRNNEYDAIVLAEAGIRRLKINLNEEFNFKRLNILPSPAQGAIGIAVRKNDWEIIDILKKINDKKTFLEVTAERFALREYGGGCQAPFGSLAKYDEKLKKLELECAVVEDGKIKREKKEISCSIDDVERAKKLGMEVGMLLK